MRLVIFGLTVSSSWGNGHATLWRGLIRALGDRGVETVYFERDVPWYAAHRDLKSLPGGRLVLYRDWGEVYEHAKRECTRAAATIVTSYCPDARAASALIHESGRGLRIFYDLDTPVTLQRLQAGENVEYLPPHGLSDFDLVLSYTGGSALEQLQTQLGARAVAPLYGSADPQAHRAVPPHSDYVCDLSYLGTWAADRHAAVQRFFLTPADSLPTQRFLLGGSQYPPDFPWRTNVWWRPHVPPPEHSRFYCSSRLTLNVTRSAMASCGYCPSGRLFEAALCGTPVVSDTWVGLDHFFTPGEEILLARRPEDVVDALRMSPERLARIGREARQRVLGEHTSAHRASELLDVLGLGAHPHRRPLPGNASLGVT